MTVKERLEDQGNFIDVAILAHGFAPHMRDYDVFLEALWGSKEWADAKGHTASGSHIVPRLPRWPRCLTQAGSRPGRTSLCSPFLMLVVPVLLRRLDRSEGADSFRTVCPAAREIVIGGLKSSR